MFYELGLFSFAWDLVGFDVFACLGTVGSVIFVVGVPIAVCLGYVRFTCLAGLV